MDCDQKIGSRVAKRLPKYCVCPASLSPPAFPDQKGLPVFTRVGHFGVSRPARVCSKCTCISVLDYGSPTDCQYMLHKLGLLQLWADSIMHNAVLGVLYLLNNWAREVEYEAARDPQRPFPILGHPSSGILLSFCFEIGSTYHEDQDKCMPEPMDTETKEN